MASSIESMDSRDKIDTWIIEKREKGSAYYYIVATSFAVIYYALASWVGTEGINLFTSMKIEMSSIINVIFYVLLISFTFLFVVYQWLYYSRILIFVEEGPTGELFTFLYSFATLTGILLLQKLPNQWLFFFAMIMFFLLLKNFQISVRLKNQVSHPLQKEVKRWINSGIVYFLFLLILAIVFHYCSVPQFVLVAIEFIIVIYFVVQIRGGLFGAKGIHVYEQEIRGEMEKFLYPNEDK